MYNTIKHAYVFTINGNLPIVNACLQMLDYDTNDFYLLCDSKCTIDLEKQLTKLKNGRIVYIGRKLINWGGHSQVSAVMTLLKEVVKSGVMYSYIHFIQGSDLPIKSNDKIVQFFEENRGKEFVDVDNSENGINWAERCCKYKYLFCHNRFYRSNKILKVLNLVFARAQSLVGIKCNRNVKFYYGSALFSITLEFAKYVVSQEGRIIKLFRWALAPDEKFMQTILMNSPYAEKIYKSDTSNEVSSNAYLIDWQQREHNSPRVWRKGDFDIIISQPNDVCFARKFSSSVDMEIVYALKDYILNNESSNI